MFRYSNKELKSLIETEGFWKIIGLIDIDTISNNKVKKLILKMKKLENNIYRKLNEN